MPLMSKSSLALRVLVVLGVALIAMSTAIVAKAALGGSSPRSDRRPAGCPAPDVTVAGTPAPTGTSAACVVLTPPQHGVAKQGQASSPTPTLRPVQPLPRSSGGSPSATAVPGTGVNADVPPAAPVGVTTSSTTVP